jgi:hypothetical protein
MSRRAVTGFLWVAAALLLPLPFFLAQVGTVPAARILMLGSVGLAVIASEGARGVVGLGAAILMTQAAFYLALLWVAAALAARGLVRLPRPLPTALTLGVVLAAVIAAVEIDLYRDPFRAHALRTNILHVYE